MIYIHNVNKYFSLVLMLALLSGMMPFGWSPEAQAADRGSRQREFQDSRYHHDRSYPLIASLHGMLTTRHGSHHIDLW